MASTVPGPSDPSAGAPAPASAAGAAQQPGVAADAGAAANATAGERPGTAGTAGGGPNSAAIELPPDPKLPTRKDTSLKEFLNKMDDYAPIIPDAVTSYYMTKAGLPPPPQTDPRLARLLALATQKFVADLAAEAYQYSRIRASTSAANNPMGNLAGGGGNQPGQPGAPGAAGGAAPGQVGQQGGGGAAGAQGAGGNKDQPKGGPLGVQRPGYGGGGGGGSQNRTVLTMEDLGMAVGEYGVNVKRSEFYR